MRPAFLTMEFGVADLWPYLTNSKVLGVLLAILLIYVGLVLLGSVLKGLYSPYIGNLIGANLDVSKQGRWAVITGATDGIGKAYAEELARKGMDIVLISRTMSKLKDVSEQIASEFKVKTKIISIDFGNSREIYDVIRKEIEDLDIGILVNNVGVSYPYPEFLDQLPDGDGAVYQMININCIAATMMCRIVIPGMVKRRKGCILNISSGASVLPLPLLSMYAGSKAYIDQFSVSLHEEYKAKGLTIQSVVPYYVATNMSKIRKPTFIAPSPTDYVRHQLRTIGLEVRTYGHFSHKLQGWGFEMLRGYLPKVFYLPFWSSMMFKTRSQCLKKKNKYRKAE